VSSSGYQQFKKVVNVQTLKDNGYLLITFETFSQPLKEFKFLVDRIGSIPNQQAHELSKILNGYNTFV